MELPKDQNQISFECNEVNDTEAIAGSDNLQKDELQNDSEADAMELLKPYNNVVNKLRNYYDSLQQEAVPAKFLDLLSRLEAAEKENKSREQKEEGSDDSQ